MNADSLSPQLCGKEVRDFPDARFWPTSEWKPLMKVRPHSPSLSSRFYRSSPPVGIDGNLQQIVHLPSPELERWEGVQSENALQHLEADGQ